MNEDEIQPIECRAAVVDFETGIKNEIRFMPTGLQDITPVSGGIERPIRIQINAATASEIERQRSLLASKGKRPYFDFNHEDGPASFWPDYFTWRPGEGVIACGEWSRRGKSAVEGKDYRAFSPVFHVDNKRAETATVVCKETADPNMGGLVNNPAFKDLPLWAKNAGQTGAQSTTTNEENEVKPEEIDALRSKIQELENRIAAKEAEGKDNDPEAVAAKSEKRSLELEIENADLKARQQSQTEVIMKQRERDADEAIKSAISRGSLLARDIPGHKRWKQRIMSDPTVIDDLKSLVGHGRELETRITGGQITVTAEDPARIYGAMASILESSVRSKRDEKIQFARQFSAIYSREISPVTATNSQRNLSMQMSEIDSVIKAADVTDTDLGTLSGTLVTQRTLELLKFQFPALSRFTTDFSDQPAQFNQTIMTRTITVPNVTSYSTTTGWTASTAATADKSVTISAHRGVHITFNENILASTVRRLFDEFAPAQACALGKDLMDALYANITTANFPNNQVTVTTAFGRSALIDIGVALNLLGVPNGPGMRTALLYSTVFGNLEKDAAIVSLGTFRQPALITGPTQSDAAYIIDVAGFGVIDAPNLPSNNANLTGFAGSKSALIIATRTPNDYTTALPGSSFGNVQMVTDPDIGITVMLVQYVDHKLGLATSRIALMYGTAAGQGNAGMLLKAAAGSGSGR